MISSRLSRGDLLLLGLILLAKIVLEAGLIQNGFTTLLTDEYAHTYRAYMILQDPSLFSSTDYRPPLPYILMAASLALHPDLFLTLRLLTILFGLWSVFLIFQLTRSLFSSQAGLVAAVLLAFFPWHVWLSATPMQEIFMVSFELGAAFQLSLFLRTERRSHLYGMCIYVTLANSVHFHAWVFTAVVSVLVLYRAWSSGWKNHISAFGILILFWLIPLLWFMNLGIVYGDPFYFVHHKIAYDKSIDLPSGFSSLQLAVRALFIQFNLFLWFVPSLFGIAYSLCYLQPYSRFHLTLSGGLLIMILGLFLAGHHSWRWERQLVPPVVLLLPFMACWLSGLFTPLVNHRAQDQEQTQKKDPHFKCIVGGIGVLILLLLFPLLISYFSNLLYVFNWSVKSRLFLGAYLFSLLIAYAYLRDIRPSFRSHLGVALLMGFVIAGSLTSFRYHAHSTREEAVRAGRFMRTLFEQRSPKIEGNVLLEVTYWDSTAVPILSNAPARFINDREIQEFSPNNASFLSTLTKEELQQFIRKNNIQLAVFRSEKLKQILRDNLHANELNQDGPYTIFALATPKQEGSNSRSSEYYRKGTDKL